LQGLDSFSSGSTFDGAGPWIAEKIGRKYSKVQAILSNVARTNGMLKFTVQTAGANPLVPVVAPDIDTFVDIVVTFGEHVRYVGTVRGDDFPNGEVFVVEPEGREVLLFDYRTGGGRNTGPLTRLAGSHADQHLGAFDIVVPEIGPPPPISPVLGS